MLTLPISPHNFVGQIMEPALDLLPAKMGTIDAGGISAGVFIGTRKCN